MADQFTSLNSLKKNGYIVAIVVPLSLVLYAYERALVPLYASGPTNAYLNSFVAAAIVVAAVNPVGIPHSLNWLLIATGLSLAPNANYWVAVWTGRYGNAVTGVSVTHATVLAPLVFLFASSVMNIPENGPTATPDVRTSIGHRISRAAIVYFISTYFSQQYLSKESYLYPISESKIYLGLATVFYLAWIFTTPILDHVKEFKGKGKGKKPKAPTAQSNWSIKNRLIAAGGFTAVWAIAHKRLENPVLPHPLEAPYTSRDGTFQVLSAIQSVTGLITVVDWLPPATKSEKDDFQMHSARYLRASHSILGGVWTHEKVMVTDPSEVAIEDAFGTPLGDSIYATFILQEGVRLINSTAKAGKLSNALVIGLGIGTSATSLMRHGISTTIVEIDPAVYDAARTWFGLPDPGAGKVYLEDARHWVEKRKDCSQSGQCPLFDTVIHDCFSGGGVPEHLFTIEFWKELKTVLDPEGVLVVNFAGIVNSESTKLVVNTLLQVFDQCRGFHDFFEDFTDEIYNTEFLNMVLFCTSSKQPLTFRNGRRSDYLGSPLRQHVLSSLSSREVDLKPLIDTKGGHLVLDANNPLGKLQEGQGSHHWEVMRTVLPNSHWETY